MLYGCSTFQDIGGGQNGKSTKFCDGRNYFPCLQKILCEFAQKAQTYEAQQAMDHLNIFKSKLDCCKDVDPVATFHNIML